MRRRRNESQRQKDRYHDAIVLVIPRSPSATHRRTMETRNGGSTHTGRAVTLSMENSTYAPLYPGRDARVLGRFDRHRRLARVTLPTWL